MTDTSDRVLYLTLDGQPVFVGRTLPPVPQPAKRPRGQGRAGVSNKVYQTIAPMHITYDGTTGERILPPPAVFDVLASGEIEEGRRYPLYVPADDFTNNIMLCVLRKQSDAEFYRTLFSA